MEGRRRRAQRLTQNIQEQPELEKDLPEAGAQQQELPAEALPAEEFSSQEIPSQEQPVEAEPATVEDSGHHRRRTAGSEAENTAEPAAHAPENGGTQPSVKRSEPRSKAGSAKKNKGKRLSAAKTLSGERVRRTARASAKAGEKALKGIGGLILLAVMAAGAAAKKLMPVARRIARKAKALYMKYTVGKELPVQEEYELELIRPEDYHGRGQAHVQKKPVDEKEKRRRALLLNRLLSVLLVCVALFSAWQIGAIILRSVRTNMLNDSLSKQRAAIIEAQENEAEQDDDAEEAADEEEDAFVPESTPMPKMMADMEAARAAMEESGEMDALYAQSEESEAQERPTATAVPAATAAPDIVKTTKYRKLGGDALPEMAELHAKNHDLVAWIQIPDVLDLPVVYRDNSYYLNHDFNKQKNTSGTIFLDVNHPFKEKTQNLLLHGHNMKDGTMFGRLAQYLYDDTYIRNHPFIYFDTLWNKEQYVIFAVLNVSLKPGDTRFFNYFTHDTFSSDKEFEMYIRQLQLRSDYAIPIDVNPSDALLTLSTCLNDDRLVIVARRLRENETRTDLRTLIRMTTKQ